MASMFLDACRLALGTLTAVPVTPPTLVDRRRAGAAMVMAPLAAVPLGVVLVLVVVAGHYLHLSPLVTALLAIGAVILGNRGFHLDGLSDVADGLAASYDRERSLAVMKSGTSGPAGVAATVLVVGLQAAGLASLLGSVEWWRGAVLAGIALCVSRSTLVVCCVVGVPPARDGGLGHSYTETVKRPTAAVALLLAAVLLATIAGWAGLPWWRGAAAAVLAGGAAAVVVARAVRRFGGVTGDVFGACVEIGFAVALVVLS